MLDLKLEKDILLDSQIQELYLEMVN